MRLRRQLPLHKGFASMRSMLAGLAETGSLCECAKHACRRRRDGFGFRLPCVRGGGPRSGGRVVKTIPQSACADSSLYTREPKNSAQTSRKPKFLLPFCKPCLRSCRKICISSPITEVSFAYFSFQRKVGFYGLKLYHRLSALSIIFENLHYILLFLILCSDIMTLQ